MNDLQKPYIFLSYSHKDDISKYIKFFENNFYNVVYDDILNYGEEWDLKIRRYIKNPLCKGAVVFLSRHSIISSAILREMDLISCFNKNYFAVLLENKTISELCNNLENNKNKDTADDIALLFSSHELYLSDNDFEKQYARIIETFKKWGFERDESDQLLNIVLDPYTTDIPDEHNRLNSQQIGYCEFDRTYLIPLIDSFNRSDLVVIDIGCASGEVTYTRFCDNEKIKKIIGIDINANDIKKAKEAMYGDKFSFYQLNIESAHAISSIRNILNENNCNGIDLIFSAFTLHHLKNPKLLLLKLFDLLNYDAKIFLRGSDDGGKICYPNNELLQKILTEYYQIFGSVNDRYNGRKLYKLLYDTGYNKISIHYSIKDTCEKTRKEKLSEFFYVGFNFRRTRLKQLAKANAENSELIKKIDVLLKEIDELELLFAQRDFWYSNTTYIAIAQVN